MPAPATHKKRTLTGSEIQAYSRNRFEDRTLRSRVRNLTEQAQVSHDRHQREIISWRSFRRESKKHSGFWSNPSDETWAMTPRAQQTQQSQFSEWNEDIGKGNRFSQAVSQPQTSRGRSPSTDIARSLFVQNEVLSRIQKPWAYAYSMESYNSVYTEALQFAKGQEKRLFWRRSQSPLSPRPNTVQSLESGVSQFQRNSSLAQIQAGSTSLRRSERSAQRPHTGGSTPRTSLSARQDEANPSSFERPQTCIGANRSVEERTENFANNAGGGSVVQPSRVGDTTGLDNTANTSGANDNGPNTSISNDTRPKTITLNREMSISMIFDEEDCTTIVVEPSDYVNTTKDTVDNRLQARDSEGNYQNECAQEHAIEEQPTKDNILTNADSASDAVINESNEEDKAEAKADDSSQNNAFKIGVETECSNVDGSKKLAAETRETSNEDVFSELVEDVLDFSGSEMKSNPLVHAATGTEYNTGDRMHEGVKPVRKLSKRASVSEEVTTVQIGKKVSISLVHSEQVLQQDRRIAQDNGTKRRDSRKNGEHGHFVRNDDQETRPGSAVSVPNSLKPTQSEKESSEIQLSVNVRRDKLTQSRSAPASPRSRDKLASLVISEETMILNFQPSRDNTATTNEKNNGTGPRSRRHATTVMPVFHLDSNKNDGGAPTELPVLREDNSTRSNVTSSFSTTRQGRKSEKGVSQDVHSSMQLTGDSTTGAQRHSNPPSGNNSRRGTTPTLSTQITPDKVSTNGASRRRQVAGANPIVHAATGTVNSTSGSINKGVNGGKTRMIATSSRSRTAERGDVVTGSASSEAKIDSLPEPKSEIDLRPSPTGQDINPVVHATTGTAKSTAGNMRMRVKENPQNGRSSRGRSYHKNGAQNEAKVAQNETTVTQSDTADDVFENTISTITKSSSANELNSRTTEREPVESPSSRPIRPSMTEQHGGQTLESRPQTSIGSPGLRSRSEGSHIYSDDVSCYSGDSDYTMFRGFYIRNYIRPQERYKADPFLTSRRERTMLRLAMENPIFLNGSRTDIKAEVIFPKKARRKVLQELVAKNSTPVRKTDKGVVPPELRAKIDEFFKTLEPLCPKPDFVLE